MQGIEIGEQGFDLFGTEDSFADQAVANIGANVERVESGHDRFGAEDGFRIDKNSAQLRLRPTFGNAVEGRADFTMKRVIGEIRIDMAGQAITELAANENITTCGDIARTTGQRLGNYGVGNLDIFRVDIRNDSTACHIGKEQHKGRRAVAKRVSKEHEANPPDHIEACQN